jgi:hypothetical protein
MPVSALKDIPFSAFDVELQKMDMTTRRMVLYELLKRNRMDSVTANGLIVVGDIRKSGRRGSRIGFIVMKNYLSVRCGKSIR